MTHPAQGSNPEDTTSLDRSLAESPVMPARAGDAAARVRSRVYIPELEKSLAVFEGELSPNHSGSVQLRNELKTTIHPGMKYLDMGTGTGVHAFVADMMGAHATGVDRDTGCAEFNNECLGRHVDVREGDLFEPIRSDEKYDVISFFPPQSPYGLLDNPPRSEVACDPGYSIIQRFFAEAGDHLAGDESVVLVVHTAGRNEIKRWARIGGLRLIRSTRKGYEYNCYLFKKDCRKGIRMWFRP